MGSPGSNAVEPPPDPGLLSLYDRALPEVYGYLLAARCREDQGLPFWLGQLS